MRMEKISQKNFGRKTWMLLLAFGLAISTALGSQGWEPTRRGLAGKDLNTVYFADAKHGWVAGDGGLILHTEDRGRTWARQTIATTDSVNDIYFRNKEDGYLLASNRIFVTENGGTDWREAGHFLPANFSGGSPELYSVRFTSKKKGWIVGSISRRETVVDSLLLYTNDGGTSWQTERAPTHDELIHLDFTSDKRGWIVGASGVILHTKDGGETWTSQHSNTNATLYHVDFLDEEFGWAVGERGTILRTTDGGETWLEVKAPVRSTLLSVKFVNEDNGWIIGRGGVILRSEDSGRTWVTEESKTKQNLYALFIDKKRGWIVGGDGIVLEYER